MQLARRVFTTDFGVVDLDQLPHDIAAGLAAAKFTKSGKPDGRSFRSVAAWLRLEDYMRERWESGQ